jgi:hypothetical protein
MHKYADVGITYLGKWRHALGGPVTNHTKQFLVGAGFDAFGCYEGNAFRFASPIAAMADRAELEIAPRSEKPGCALHLVQTGVGHQSASIEKKHDAA